MPNVARLGDSSDHGGTLTTASEDTFANGIGVGRHGDLHDCPIEGHGVTAMNSDSDVFVNGRPVVRIGVDHAGCGAAIVGGSPDTFANGG